MLKYFWIAEYNDKTTLSQFDPETGKENLFKDINQSKLIRFGWHPFSDELSKKVQGSLSTSLPKYIINLNKNDTLIARRRNYIQIKGTYESRYIDYLLGTQNYLIYIDEFGNVEVRNSDLNGNH